MVRPKQAKGVTALVALSFGFGAIAIAGRLLGFVFTPLQQLYLAAGIGFIISLIIFKRSLSLSKIRKISSRDWLVIVFRVVAGYLIAGSLYRESLVLTKISNVVFIQSIPFAAIFGWLLFKEKFTFKKLFYVLTAFAGVILIAVSDYLSIFNFGKGELLSLISSALFTLSYVARRWQSDDLNDQELAQIFLFLGAIFMFVASIAIGEKFPTVNWQLPILLAIFFTAFFNAVNIFLINYGFRRVKAVLAGNILTLEAIFALILAFIFFRELPTLKELTGGLLIIVSVIQMNKLEET